MLFLASALILLFAVDKTNQQRPISLVAKMPSDYTLLKDDVVRLPVDDYVSLSGATVRAGEGNNKMIIPKISPWNQVELGTNLINACTLTQATKDYVVMICSLNVLVKIDLDNQLGQKKGNITNVTLAHPEINDAPFCTDLVISGGAAYVACMNKNTKGNLVIFNVQINSVSTFKAYLCPRTENKGFARLSMIAPPSAEAGSNQMYFLIHNPFQIAPSTNTGIKFTRCVIELSSSGGSANCADFDLFNLWPSETFTNGIIKHFSTITNNEILFAVAFANQTNKTLTFGIINHTTSQLTPFAKANFNTTIFNGTAIDFFSPYHMAIKRIDGSSSNLVAFDKYNMYEFNLTLARNNTGTSTINVTAPRITIVDCGMSMDAAEDVTTVSRVTDIDGTFYTLNRRLLVEYRTVSNADLKGFAVVFTGRKYGCSKNGAIVANGVSLVNQNLMIGSIGDKFFYYKLNPSTFL